MQAGFSSVQQNLVIANQSRFFIIINASTLKMYPLKNQCAYDQEKTYILN